MSRTWPVIKREFNEMVRTKAFVAGTVLGPVFIIGIFALQILFMRPGGGERTIAIVAEGEEALAREVATVLGAVPPADEASRVTRFHVEVVSAGADPEAVRTRLVERVQAEELDGYLWLPADVIDGGRPVYEGQNATNMADLARIENAVQMTVQGTRLRSAGIDPAQVAAALRPVDIEARKIGGKAASGTPAALIILTYIIGFVIYMAVILYGNAAMRGVLEEKRDRVVEVVMSSIRAEELMVGKVIGIGGAGLLQILIWAGFGAFLLTQGDALAARLGGGPAPDLPDVPLSVGGIFLFFFFGGFFLYSGIYAAMGAIATTDQEAQQLQWPVFMPLIVAIMMMGAVIQDPDSTAAVAGSLIPFTAPVVMPMRAAIGEVPALHLIVSALGVIATTCVTLWLGARIYRVGVLETGKRASAKEVWSWVRSR